MILSVPSNCFTCEQVMLTAELVQRDQVRPRSGRRSAEGQESQFQCCPAVHGHTRENYSSDTSFTSFSLLVTVLLEVVAANSRQQENQKQEVLYGAVALCVSSCFKLNEPCPANIIHCCALLSSA